MEKWAASCKGNKEWQNDTRQENLIFSVVINKRKQLKVISTTYREIEKLKIAIKVIIVILLTI